MSNNVDPDETAHDEPSHLDLCCLQKPVIIACGRERVLKRIRTSPTEQRSVILKIEFHVWSSKVEILKADG